MRSLLLAGCAGLLVAGCASTAVQTEALLRDPGNEARAARIPGVPFVEQAENYCGPATLAMAMDYAGKRVPVGELAAQVYTPGKKGSLQQDMLGSARRQGMLAVQVWGLPSLLREVEAGHPVIVFLNLGFRWYPIYHYALVTGFDLKEPVVVMHSGTSENKEWSLRKFELSWELGGYWGLVVLPPAKLSAAADELEHSAAAAGLEAAGRGREAEVVYRNMLRRWPGSFGALVGLGNLTFARGEVYDSVRYLRAAVSFHPSSAPAWHNLAVALEAVRKKKEAKAVAAKALALAPLEKKGEYRSSLQSLLGLPAAVYR